MIIQYGSFEEIEEYILNIEDKTGIFLIEPKGKGKILVSSFATGTSEELRADLLESYFKEKEGTHAFFIGIRPPRCLNPYPADEYDTKESIGWCEKIMHLSIGNPTYDQIDYCLENLLAIIRDLESESDQLLEMLREKEDRQQDIDPSGLDLFGNEDLPISE
jgi:hypothetical protein